MISRSKRVDRITSGNQREASMSSDPAIFVSQVSKRFQIYATPEDRLKQMVPPPLRRVFGLSRSDYFSAFQAVKDVSLEVGRGETVGILGRNGSGKSTLLQLICGTLQPSAGSINVRGRIAALLELGAGFSPEFTGRQNVFLNCAILGLSAAETEARFEAIERFADIGIFIDQPVKTYSSGMYIRLAFAVAINVDPDILIIDEALAVGDEAFQRKCFARIEQIRDNGATILFVSHGAQTILQLCDRAILLDHGEKLMDGPPKPVVQQYQRLIHADAISGEAIRSELRTLSVETVSAAEPNSQPLPGSPTSIRSAERASQSPQSVEALDAGMPTLDTLHYGEHTDAISNLRLETPSGRKVNVLCAGERYRLCYDVDFPFDASGLVFGAQIKTISGLVIAGVNTSKRGSTEVHTVRSGARCSVVIEFSAHLVSGTYCIDAGIAVSEDVFRYLHRMVDALAFRVRGSDEIVEVGYVQTNPIFRTTVQTYASEIDPGAPAQTESEAHVGRI